MSLPAKPEYELSKSYTVSGIQVLSEIVADRDTPEYRAFHIRTSCPSDRWGIRTVGHSLTCYKATGTNEVLDSLERTRLCEAERIVKVESGVLPERPSKFLGVQIQGPTGKTVNTIASPDLSLSTNLLTNDLITFLELRPAAQDSFQRRAVSLPIFEMTVAWGSMNVHTIASPGAPSSPPCILGGDFFQQALKGKEDLIIDLVLPDDRRALAAAARCKKRHVLIAGKYGAHRSRLEKIKTVLSSAGFIGLILDEYPDIEEQSLPEKMVTYASICRFVIVDDLVPSGHINELGICSERKFVTAILRKGGRASTAMQADIADEIQFMREFSYMEDTDFEARILDAAKWADETVNSRARRLNRKYSEWRGPDKIM